MRLVIQLYLCLALAAPFMAQAEPAAPAKDPLSYPLKQYALVLAMAILGGLVSWAAKVRSGEAQAWNVMQLIGELATSAFAGLIAFWGCEYLSLSPLITPAVVGVAGHMGTRGIAVAEQALQNWLQRKTTPP